LTLKSQVVLLMNPLAISHYSLVNCLGSGRDAFTQGLHAGRSGLAPCAFETVTLDTFVGEIAGLDEPSFAVRSDLAPYDCRNNRLAQHALEVDGFADDVRRLGERIGTDRIGIFMGTSTSGILQSELAYRRRNAQSGALPEEYRYAETHNAFSLADFVQRYLGLKGPAYAISSACSSSAKVFAHAARMIAAGICDAAVVGGVDSLCLTTLYGFNALGLVSPRPCRPYDADRDGISIGEGAGFALLEPVDENHSAPRLLGVGESCDAHHMSTPHPEGLGAKLAMQRALESARLDPAHVDYVNLHGTGTKTNDAAEDKATYDLFGENTPCSSTKGATGHLLGAAGITEVIVSLIALEHDFAPGGVHTRNIDPQLRCRYLTANTSARVRRVLTNSFGFGGSNCSLVVGSAA
jgi:3-oxoacyl-[acyl-carrier-protein] synthase-1